MDISIKRGTPGKQKTPCMIVAVHSGKKLAPSAAALDTRSRGALSRLVKRGDIAGKVGDALLLPDVTGIDAERVLLVGAGKASGISQADYLKLVGAAAVVEAGLQAERAVSALLEITLDDDDDLAWKIRQPCARVCRAQL